MLFAYITDQEVCFLGVAKHYHGAFGDITWQEILHDHFPEVIEKYKDPGITDLTHNPDKEDRQTAWDKGLTLGLVKVRDTVYMAPGIGRATSGNSIMVVRLTGSILRWLHEIGNQFDLHHMAICNNFNLDPSDGKFNLTLGSSGLHVVHSSSGQPLISHPQTFQFPPV